MCTVQWYLTLRSICKSKPQNTLKKRKKLLIHILFSVWFPVGSSSAHDETWFGTLLFFLLTLRKYCGSVKQTWQFFKYKRNMIHHFATKFVLSGDSGYT